MLRPHSANFLSIGAVVALAFGSATVVSAQSTPSSTADTTTAVSQERIPVTKQQGIYDTTTSTGALDTTTTDTTMSDTSMTDTSTTMTDTLMTDTSTTTDTTSLPTDTSAVTTDTSTGEVITRQGNEPDTIGMYPSSSSTFGRLGRGFWIGVGGGASIPTGNLHDGGYDTGWNITVPIGWQAARSPLGLRLDLSYDRLNGSTIASTPVNVTLSDANLWSGTLDLTLQFPFGRSGSSFYLMGGGGIHHFTDIGSENGAAVVGGNALSSSGDESLTKAGINGGLGLNFGFGRAKLFLESRYVSVFTEGENSNFIPVILGVRVF